MMKLTRIVYGVLGILYVLLGAGSMLLPTGWLPDSLTSRLQTEEMSGAFYEHLLQEFGAVLLALGFMFLWYSRRNDYSRVFHWAMTFYFALDALIHWIGPNGIIGSWQRGIINSSPFVVMLVLGLLQSRDSNPRQRP